MPKFKIGDKVRIKDDLVLNNYYGDVQFTTAMFGYTGCVATITNAVYPYSGAIEPIGYLLNIDGGDYTWSDSMLDLMILNDDEAEINDIGVASKQEHYKKASMQPIQFMQTLMTAEQFDGFLLGQVIKYKCRENFKDQKASDINKARQYLYWLKLHREGHIIDPVKDSVPDSFEYTGI